MECEQARQCLVEIMDGAIDEARGSEAKRHLAECAACRQELRRLERGHEALAGAARELAPRAGYLTAERFARLQDASGAQWRTPRIITWRRFAAAAAIAAILVSSAFIYRDLQTWRSDGGASGGSAPIVAERPTAPSAPAAVRVVLTSRPQEGGSRVVIGQLAPETGLGVTSRRGVAQVVRSSADGIRIPVSSVAYDPEEANYWW